MEAGKIIRFSELYNREEPIIVCPVDDTLISGPVNGLENPLEKIKKILSVKPTAFLSFPGTITRHAKDLNGIRIIVNLSVSTYRSLYTRKMLIGTIETALRLSASAVAVHVNVSSKYAGSMYKDAGFIIEQAARYSMPVVGIMYPRGESDSSDVEEYDLLRKNEPKKFTQLIAHCVQIGVDLGVDLIKTQYLGEDQNYEALLNVSNNTPIVIAGGPLVEEDVAVSRAVNAIKRGVAGISFARNVFGREDPCSFIKRIKKSITQ